MRIAFFNWRDIKNPEAGGSELYIHKVMKNLSLSGHKVTLFTSSFPGSPKHEIIEGIEHVRYGGKFTIYAKSHSCYKKHIKGNYDLIVESINGVPFFTNLFAKETVIPFIHQLTRENWYSGICFPIAFIGYHLEDSLLSTYKRNPTIVPSNSTKLDLEALDFTKIKVIHGATDLIPSNLTKEKKKTILYLGRLTKSKRVDHVIRAFDKVWALRKEL